MAPGTRRWAVPTLRAVGVFVAAVVGVELGLSLLVRHREARAEEDD